MLQSATWHETRGVHRHFRGRGLSKKVGTSSLGWKADIGSVWSAIFNKIKAVGQTKVHFPHD